MLSGEGPQECTSCPPHSMLEAGMCMACLGAQYYDHPTRLCRNCHLDCHRCTGPGKFSCSGCAPPLHLDKLNNQCVPCCKGEEKLDETEECCVCDPETGESISAVKLISRLSVCATAAAILSCFSPQHTSAREILSIFSVSARERITCFSALAVLFERRARQTRFLCARLH